MRKNIPLLKFNSFLTDVFNRNKDHLVFEKALISPHLLNFIRIIWLNCYNTGVVQLALIFSVANHYEKKNVYLTTSIIIALEIKWTQCYYFTILLPYLSNGSSSWQSFSVLESAKNHSLYTHQIQLELLS